MSKNANAVFNADARFAVRAATQDAPAVLEGYAVVWNALSSDRGGYFVRFAPHSVRFSGDVRALWDHSPRDVFGRTGNGHLRLSTDETGVKFGLDLPNTTAGRDLAEYVRRKDIQGMSFGVANWPPPGRETYETLNGRAAAVYTVTDADIDEITVTGNPAFTASTVDVKAAFAALRSANPDAVAADLVTLDELRFSSLRTGTF